MYHHHHQQQQTDTWNMQQQQQQPQQVNYSFVDTTTCASAASVPSSAVGTAYVGRPMVSHHRPYHHPATAFPSMYGWY